MMTLLFLSTMPYLLYFLKNTYRSSISLSVKIILLTIIIVSALINLFYVLFLDYVILKFIFKILFKILAWPSLIWDGQQIKLSLSFF